MASKKLSSDTSLANSYKLSRGVASVARPSAPTIGTATDTADGAMSVTFTASTLGPTASSFTLTSSSGVTASGASSPLTLQEVATGTYTYSVSGTNANGTGPSSAASNSAVVASVYSNSFSSIATATGAGSSTSVTFSSIPNTYTHLQIRMMASAGYGSYNNTGVLVDLNADATSANYSYHYILASGSGAVASGGSASGARNLMTGMDTPVSTSTYGVAIIDILDYANTNKLKTLHTSSGFHNNTTNTADQKVGIYSLLWNNTAAINSIKLTFEDGNITTGSKIALYGVMA